MNETRYDKALFAELYDVQPQAIMWSSPVWSDDGRTIVDFDFTYCNDEALKYLNLTRRQLQGLLFSTSPTLTPDLRKKVMAEMIQVYQTGKKSETNIFNPALNKYARVLRTRLRNGVLTVVQDRTEENRIIRQLEEQTKQLQAQKNILDNLLKYSPAGISITEVTRDAEGNIVDGRTILANNLGVEYIGLPKEILLTKTVKQVDPEILESPLYQLALNTLKTNIPFHTQYYFEPSERWLELSVAKMDDNHRINVFMDVTTTKEAQLRQQKLLEELQRSNANLQEFAYAASHDLQEPLRKVYTFADRIKNELATQLTENQQLMFGRIESATQRMRNLIEDLLSYSQVSVKTDVYEPVALNDIVQQVVSDLETLIADTGAMVHVGTLPQLKSDERQLRQLFQNLIGNAIKYRKQGVQPQVTITSRNAHRNDAGFDHLPQDHGAGYCLVQVKDNGIGFEQENAEKIFQVFQRLHGKAEYEGTGVGLAIAQKVVINHKGYINAQSKPGEGATFNIFLPQ